MSLKNNLFKIESVLDMLGGAMIGITLGKYLFINYIKICLFVILLISVLSILIDFTQTSSHLSSIPNYKNSYAIIISSLRLPFLLLQTLPFVILITALLYFFILNKNSELVIMRSIGISAWQFIFPICFAAFFSGCLAILLLNPLSSYSLTKANSLIAQWNGNKHNFTNSLHDNPWLIQKTNEGETEIKAQNIIKNIKGVEVLKQVKPENNKLINPNQTYVGLQNSDFVFIATPQTKTSPPNISFIHAEKTFLLPSFWLLINPQIYTTNGKVINPQTYLLKTNIKPKFLETYLADPNTIAFYKLFEKIQIAKNFGYNSYGFQMVLHYLIALPMLLATMALIAATVSLKFSRNNNFKISAFYGVIYGFLLYLISNLAQNFAKVGLLPPVIAAWAPILIALFIGLSFLLNQEDG